MYTCTKCGKKKQQHEFKTRNSNKNGIESICKVCVSEASKVYYEKKKEEIKTKARQYREEHTEGCKEAGREYTAKNKEKLAKYRKAYYQANKDEYAKKAKEYYKTNKDSVRERRRINSEAVNATNAKRRAARKKALPIWLTPQDLADIKSVYKSCKNITKKTGIVHHVDHIIPLQGELVSGLHVPNNLQVIPAVENMKKHNSFDEDMVCTV